MLRYGACRLRSCDGSALRKGNLTEVVGVAKNGKYHDLQEPPQPVTYLPLSQSGDSGAVFGLRSRRSRVSLSELFGVVFQSYLA